MASISKLGKTYISAAEVTAFVTTAGIDISVAQCDHIAAKLAEKLQMKNNDANVMKVALRALAGHPYAGTDILTFVLSAQTGAATIDTEAGTVAIEVANGTNVTALQPTITLSPYATVSPASGAATDFTSPVTYTVTAEDGTEKEYTVTVTVAEA